MYFANKNFVHVSDVRALARILADAQIRAYAREHQQELRLVRGVHAEATTPRPVAGAYASAARSEASGGRRED